MNDTCICENTPTVWRLTGVTRTLRLRIFNPDGTPLDLTGRTVAVTIARDNSEFSYAPGFVIEGDDHNVIKFEWPADKQGAGDYTINVTTTDGSGNVDRVNWHGPTGIRLVDFSFMVRGEDALGVTSEANIGLDGTFTMNGTGMSAYDEWLAEGHTGTPEEFIAWLRQPAVDAASAADAQMGQIQERADADHTRAGNDHTTAGQDHTRAGNDHTTATDDHRIAAADHSTATDDHTLAASDHATAEADHTQAASDHTQASSDHTTAEADHGIAASDHTAAAADHTQAGSDHSRAESDHTTAASDHSQAGTDHTRAEGDHATAGQDHTQAGSDHTTAAGDHTTAAADHTQAVADHAVMAGYDTRLGNVESEVSQLGQELNGKSRVDIDFSEYNAVLGILQENGTWWVPSVNNFHKAIPVVPGDVYVINANTAEPSVYALVKSYSPPIDGQAIDLCAGTSVTKLARGTSQTITIPNDCTYIVFNVTMSSVDRTPSAFYQPEVEGEIHYLQGQIDNINDSLAVRATTDLTGELSPGYIATNGEVGTVVDTTVVSNTGFLHKIVSVEKGDVATIKGLGAGAPRLWCFTDRNYKIISHAEAATSISEYTHFTADSDGYFIFNTYNNVSYGFSLTAKTGETYMEKVDQLEQENTGKLDKSVVELSQSVEFASGYFLYPSGALNPAPINTSKRRYTTNMIGGGFTVVLKPYWYLRSLNKYDKYGNFLENIQYGSSYTGAVTIQDAGNSNYFQFDAEYTERDYPTTVLSPIKSITFAKTKVDVGANSVELYPQEFEELDLSFDLSGIEQDYPAQPRIIGLANLYALWDDIVTNYGGTKVNAATEAGITPPAYMENAQPLYIYKFLSNQSRNDKSKHIKVLVYAGEHVNEYLSHNILLKFMQRICGDWATDHNCELLRSMVDWYVLPCINPYGYDSKNERTNYNGVNINRNFATSNWKSGEVGDNYGGPSAASEFETQIVQYYVEKIKPDIMMDVHTGNTNTYGSIGSLEMSVNDLYFNKMDFYKLASTICRTGSNLFTIANPNYPQNLVTPLLDTNVQLESEILALGTANAYTGLSHQYAMEKGVKLALLIELNQVSNWVNGVYGASAVGDRAESSAALARGNLLYFIDTMYRAVKAISQNQS